VQGCNDVFGEEIILQHCQKTALMCLKIWSRMVKGHLVLFVTT
jgi:hypothetical protein